MGYSAITTGQFVQIHQKSATLADRALALGIDLFIISAYIAGGFYLINKMRDFNWARPSDTVFYVLFLLIPTFYFLIFEIFTNGQTIGKRLMHIRVAMKDSTPPTLGAYLLRWVIMPVDVFITGGLGAIFIVCTKHHQRLGDLAAGTIVIKEQNFKHLQINLDEFNYLAHDYQPTYPQAADLSLEQINIISRTLDDIKNRHKRMEQLAMKVHTMLQIAPNREESNEDFLRTIIRDYQYFALEE